MSWLTWARMSRPVKPAWASWMAFTPGTMNTSLCQFIQLYLQVTVTVLFCRIFFTVDTKRGNRGMRSDLDVAKCLIHLHECL